jgi:small nuclear ribonucleoprotein (snRNP)-like protein
MHGVDCHSYPSKEVPLLKRVLSTGIALFALIALTINANSATLYFKNGDRLTGTLKSFSKDAVTIVPSYGTTADVQLNQLSGLATGTQITLQLQDGRYFTGMLDRNETGTMSLSSEGSNVLESVTLDNVDRLYSEDPRETLR